MAKTAGEGPRTTDKTKSYVQQGKTVNRNKAADNAARAGSASIQHAEAKAKNAAYAKSKAKSKK